jgi:molecular chaperone IbpA
MLLIGGYGMRSFDFSPLYRYSVGFDRMARMLDAASRVDDSSTSYPPYNIEVTGENAYRISMAVAGFGEQDLSIVVHDNALVVSGRIEKQETNERQFLHRGIAARAFDRKFELADHIKVAGASLAKGLLHIELVREVPEAAKPRTVKIESAGGEGKTKVETRAA